MPWVAGLSLRFLARERAHADAARRSTAVDALLELARRHALAALTVTRLQALDEPEDAGMPHPVGQHGGQAVLVEIVDRVERLEPLVPKIAALASAGPLSVSAVRLYIPPAALLVRDVMVPPRAVARRDTPLLGALRPLLDAETRLLFVTGDSDRLEGILTLGHVLRAAAPDVAGRLVAQPHAAHLRAYMERLAAGHTAGDVMLREPTVAGPDLGLAAAARLMERQRVTRLPVVDGDGRAVGLLRERDLLSALIAPLGESPDAEPAPTGAGSAGKKAATAGALADVATQRLQEGAPAAEVVRALQRSADCLALVVGPDGDLRGIVDEHALARHAVVGTAGGLRAAVKRALQHDPDRVAAALASGNSRLTARDLVRPAPLVLPAEVSIAEAMARMVSARDGDLAVVADADGRPRGILWRRDTLRALLGDA